ncbi:KR domain-containing protein, partial [Streptomyces sp. NPDC059627]
TAPPPRDAPAVEGRDPHALAEAWAAGRGVVWPTGPAPAPWDFPPPAFDTAEYDFPRAAGEPSGVSRLPAAQWLHQPLWTRSRRARTGAAMSRRTAVVVIGPGQDGESWRFLERHYARVVTVRAGQGLTRLGDDRYEADVADAGQLTALLGRLTGTDAPDRPHGPSGPDRPDGPDAPAVDWLHALPLALDGDPATATLETAEWACLDTVAALALALAGLPEPDRPRAWLLSQRAQPVTGSVHTPEAGLLAAALEVPRQELGVTLRWTDLPGPHPAGWAARLPDLLLDETLTVTDRATALRDGFWWRRSTVPVPVGEAPRPTAAPGTHLVLGGTGGLGTTLAASLLLHPGNQVVLVARGTEVPAPLREFGERVTLVTADLAAEEPAAVADRLAPLLDGLAGIVHAAGTAAGGLLARREPAAARAVTAAKLRGALLAELLVAEHAPDYVLYCSSMAARFGGVGQFDYAAANACLDAYAHHTPPGGDATVRTSVGWDAWREVGMAQRHASRADARHREHLTVALTPEEGTAVFERALHLQLPYLMVSTTDLTAARAFYASEPVAAEPAGPEPAAPAPEPAPAPAVPVPEGDLGAEVTDILLALLGVDSVDPRAALYDLGADSLTLLELLDEIKRRYGTDIELSRLSHRVSLAELLGHLGDGVRPPGTVDVEVWQRGPGPDVLCLVHPVGGDIQAYRPLVSALSDDLTVCLIADPGLRDPGLPDRPIDERAGHYLAAVRREFPEPGRRLRLAGWSFGAWTALSMAALAEGEDRPVTALHLLDPPPPGAGHRLAGYDEERIQAVFARELSGNGAGRPTEPVHGTAGPLPGPDPAAPLTESGRVYAERLARCCRANLAAMAGHLLPRLHRTPAAVWLATRPVAEAALAPEPTAPGAWDAHLPSPYRLHHVDADHYQIVAEPHVGEIAAALAETGSPSDARPQPAGRI